MEEEIDTQHFHAEEEIDTQHFYAEEEIDTQHLEEIDTRHLHAEEEIGFSGIIITFFFLLGILLTPKMMRTSFSSTDDLSP